MLAYYVSQPFRIPSVDEGSEMLRGIFRDSDDWARVRYANGREIDMPKARYIANRIQPAFDELPREPPDASAALPTFPLLRASAWRAR